MWTTSLLLLLSLLSTRGFSETEDEPENDNKVIKVTLEELQEIMKDDSSSKSNGERAKRSLKRKRYDCAKKTPGSVMCMNQIGGSAAKNFEGDIVLTGNQDKRFHRRYKRKVLSRPYVNRWDPKMIPYKFHFNIDSAQQRVIKKALKIWEDKTCIHFEHDGKGDDYIFFKNENGCYSGLGRSSGRNLISVGILVKKGKKSYVDPCDKTAVVHEVGHSLGFSHEQNRPDRDKYVKILWKNIDPEMKQNFEKYKFKDSNPFGKGYDFLSIMHYGPRDFSKNGKPTIVPRNRKNYIPEFHDKLTKSEIEQMNKAYCSRILKINSINGNKIYDSDCKLSPWEPWSHCKTPCSKRYRTRRITIQSSGNGRCGTRKQSKRCRGCMKKRSKRDVLIQNP